MLGIALVRVMLGQPQESEGLFWIGSYQKARGRFVMDLRVAL